APVRTAIFKVAILPFKGPTELIGSSASDMVVTEILRANRYTLVERSQMAGVLSETELSMAGLSESKAVEVAKMLGADGVVIGTVDEYATQAQGGRTHAVVGISIRLIHCQSGQIMWSADLAKVAEDSKIPLAAHGRAVVHELMAGLYQKWGVQKTAPAMPGRPSTGTPPLAAPPPAAPPAAPMDVAASDMGLREVTLKWKPPAGPVASYRIERAPAAEGPFVRAGEAQPVKGSFTDRTGLKDATAYYYRIVAVGAPGLASSPSAVVESMTAPPPDPPKPVVAVARGSRAVMVTWMPPRVEGVVRYRVERSMAAEPEAWSPRGEMTVTNYADGGRPGTDLLDSTEYLYRVSSINRVGATGAPSAVARVTTLPPPAAVQGFSALSAQVRCVPLTWSPSPEADVSGYEIERLDSPTGSFSRLTKIVGRPMTAHLDGKRDPGDLLDAHVYAYRIRPFNGVGSFGAWAGPVEATTRPPPPAPEGLAAKAGLPRAVEVVWQPSADEKVTGYVVQRAEGLDGVFAQTGTVEGHGTTIFLDRAGASRSAPTGRLKDGTVYRYQVRAVNTARAMSEWCAEAQAVTKPAPAAPAGLEATADRPKSVNLKWTANPETDITAYDVEAREASGSRWREVARVTGPAATHRGIDDGSKHVYRVKAVDRDTLESAWSAEVPGAARPLPGAPAGVKAEWTADGAKLSWTPPRDGMREFRIYRKGFLSSEKILTSPESGVSLAPSLVGKKLVVTVTAVDEEGLESEPSAAVDIRPPAAVP
ncbi:MAG: fibronectin type III domain-containing protein, partial [Verrucomicrobia bacterium]|nr:fibronectin type III domain-containing protein [Verrucomicrobiota bacterium]